MFFVLHANVCGHGLPHHGHSHGFGSHAHLHESNDHHSRSDDSLTVDVISGHEHTRTLSQNINVRAAVIHVIGDFFQSIGVLLAAILIKIKVCRRQKAHLEDRFDFFSRSINSPIRSARLFSPSWY